jgi:AbrB family looped-hinge helix DNA binding protein
MKAIVSGKGQVTIPRAVRSRLGIHPGTVIDFESVEGRRVGVKRDRDEDPVDQVTGIIERRGDIGTYLAETRGPAA